MVSEKYINHHEDAQEFRSWIFWWNVLLHKKGHLVKLKLSAEIYSFSWNVCWVKAFQVQRERERLSPSIVMPLMALIWDTKDWQIRGISWFNYQLYRVVSCSKRCITFTVRMLTGRCWLLHASLSEFWLLNIV